MPSDQDSAGNAEHFGAGSHRDTSSRSDTKRPRSEDDMGHNCDSDAPPSAVTHEPVDPETGSHAQSAGVRSPGGNMLEGSRSKGSVHGLGQNARSADVGTWRGTHTQGNSFQRAEGTVSMASVPDVYRESFQFRPVKPVVTDRKKILRYIFIALSCVALLLVIVGTPLDMFRARDTTVCVTLWGSRPRCGSPRYTPTDWGCAERRNAINAARAFCIVTIAVMALAIVTGVFLALRFGFFGSRHLIPAILSIASVLTLVIAWACVAGVYHERQCSVTDEVTGDILVPAKPFKETHRLGAGFGVLVGAWCIQVIATIVVTWA